LLHVLPLCLKRFYFRAIVNEKQDTQGLILKGKNRKSVDRSLVWLYIRDAHEEKIHSKITCREP
jgi:hypothetical protein